MKKDRFYFPHDHFARLDPKIRKLIMELQEGGYGLYWMIVEMLHENGGSIEEDYHSIAYELRTEYDRIKMVIQKFNLFIIQDGFIFSQRVNDNIQERELISNKNTQNINKRWEKERSKQAKDTTVIRPYESGNTIKEIKGKEIKEIKQETINKSEILKTEFENQFTAIESLSVETGLTIDQVKEKIPEFIQLLITQCQIDDPFKKQWIYFTKWLKFQFNKNGTGTGNHQPTAREKRRIGKQNYDFQF